MTPDVATYFRYWGKADPVYPGDPKWHPLAYHCLDVAAVGREYLRRNPRLRALITQFLDAPDTSGIEDWLIFCLALHDLGKFSEAFQSQRADLFLQLRGRAPNPAKSYRIRHDTLGMLFWKGVLRTMALDGGWYGAYTEDILDGVDYWFRAVTGHHGQPPHEGTEYWSQHFDTEYDRSAICAFVAEVQQFLLSASLESTFSSIDPDRFYRVSRELSWWIAGVAVLADWLGSNTQYFPYREAQGSPLSLRAYWIDATKQAVAALACIIHEFREWVGIAYGFVVAWTRSDRCDDDGLGEFALSPKF
ncbi:MAG: CRISPR-associated endonuclease Cas3'', partial [Burkholderiales bacterium]|nr:CRISPR-associated endonuclease Cas3'' [Burkholderiales bacterium]